MVQRKLNGESRPALRVRNGTLKFFYKPKKILGNRKLLNRLDALGVAIWYMDDGHINIRKSKEGKIHGFYIKIATCLPKEEV